MATIHYARLDEFWRKEEKYAFLDEQRHVGNVAWQPITPDKRHTWLTEGMQEEFESFIALGAKDTRPVVDTSSIFQIYSNGVKTHRDVWVYSYDEVTLTKNVQQIVQAYNEHVYSWERLSPKPPIDEFIDNDSRKISWSRDLKLDVQRGKTAEFEFRKIRRAVYRPFVKQYLFFDKLLNEEVYQFPRIFPTDETIKENQAICVSDKGHRSNFSTLVITSIVDVHLLASTDSFQCFPFYTYDEDGTNRRENITDWALAAFRHQYATQSPDHPITKWDIFHYVYALLHHPDYRANYAANLRRELPRIPFVADFWGFVQAGAQLAALHVGYEAQPEYRLDFVENPDQPLDWRVERMKLSKDKRSLVYNDFLTLAGIPPQVYDYKLGNRSALEWVIDQYQVSTDKRSGIVNDPNQPDDPQAILRLIGQVITVSLATVQIVNSLPPLTIQPSP